MIANTIFNTKLKDSKLNPLWVNSGKVYSEKEIHDLTKTFVAGKTLQSLCDKFGRSPGGIITKLHDLGLLITCDDKYVTTERAVAVSGLYLTDYQLKEETMTTKNQTSIEPITSIDDRIFVNGCDISDVSDVDLYEIIYATEERIRHFDAINNKPKKLLIMLDKLEADVKKLVAYIDARE